MLLDIVSSGIEYLLVVSHRYFSHKARDRTIAKPSRAVLIAKRLWLT